MNMLIGDYRPTYIVVSELLTQNLDCCIVVRYTYSTQDALASTMYDEGAACR